MNGSYCCAEAPLSEMALVPFISFSKFADFLRYHFPLLFACGSFCYEHALPGFTDQTSFYNLLRNSFGLSQIF